jgi:hypothetical protein
LFSSSLFVALIPNVALAQAGVVKGTVVIVNQTKDELIMAADSVAVPDHGKPDYSYCKIATLKGNVLFAGLNGQVLADGKTRNSIPGWNGWEIARDAVNAESVLPGFPNEEHLVNIAARWADKMSERLQRLVETNPQSAIALAKLGNGALAGGIFAEADHGAIHTQIAVLSLNRHSPMTVDWVIWAKLGQCWPCDQENGKLCALGHSAVAKEFA